MDVKETSEILKYKRPCDSWLCPDCDTENNISLGKCTVCGGRKSPSAKILKQWTEEYERPAISPKKTPTPAPSGPVFKDTDKDDYIPEEKSKSKIIWWIIFALLIAGIIIAGLQANLYVMHSDALDESICQCATEYLDSGDFTLVESLVESNQVIKC